MKVIRLVIIAAFLISVSGCATSYNPATGRQEAVFIDTAQEVNIGSEVEKAILAKQKLSQNPAFKHKANRIGSAIAAVSDRKDLKYKFDVIESKDINAFALPGGSVFVTSGLLRAVESDDELACVIGHEVGHISARHPVKRLESQLGYSFLVNLAYMLDTRSADEKKKVWENIAAATNITFGLITLGYSRKDEILADRLGAVYAERAGYNPRAAITFLKKLEEKEKHSSEWLVFLRSHPYSKDRIMALEEWMGTRATRRSHDADKEDEPEIVHRHITHR